jgi:hypothetical protein
MFYDPVSRLSFSSTAVAPIFDRISSLFFLYDNKFKIQYTESCRKAKSFVSLLQ